MPYPAEPHPMQTESEPMTPPEPIGRDQFAGAPQNIFRVVREQPVSTFSIDVDTASYAFVRASLNNNVLPQPDAIRTEELINYFPYDYPDPRDEHPVSITTELAGAPWRSGHLLARIGLATRSLDLDRLPPNNLVFLIDVSGSMAMPAKR